MNRKSPLCVLLALLLLFTALPLGLAETADGGVTNVSGLPIVSEPVTLKTLMYYSLYSRTDYTSVIDYIREQTGIQLEMTVPEDTTQVSLQFASRDFPDLAFSTGVANTILYDLADAGDLVCLDDYLQTYMPTWYAFFTEEDVTTNKLTLFPDGRRYTLPKVDNIESSRDLRDEWFINQVWLDELNLATPATTDEFADVLRAFKANAGKGSIPANAVPLLLRYDAFANGGQYDLLGCFGVYVSDANYMTMQDGQAIYQGVNPDIKPALQYLRDLYAEGLITAEMFTIDSATYSASIDSGMVGSYFKFSNTSGYNYQAIAPLKSAYCDTPAMRRQPLSASDHRFMIFAGNEYPVASARLAEWASADPRTLMTVWWGKEGLFWDYTEDGKVMQTIAEGGEGFLENIYDWGFHFGFATLFGWNMRNLYYDKMVEVTGSRVYDFYNVYQATVPSYDLVYVGGGLSPEETERMNELATDLNNHRKTTFANWISGLGDVEADWDAYVQENEAMGLAEYLTLKQKAYDNVH